MQPQLLMCDFLQRGVLGVRGRRGAEGLRWRMYAHGWLACRVTGQVIGEEGDWLWEPYSSSMALRHWMEQRGAGLFAGLEPCPGRRNSDTEQLVGPLASFIGLDSEVSHIPAVGVMEWRRVGR